MTRLTKASWFGVILVCLGFVAFQTAEAILCYQCADTQYESPCVQDEEGFVNTSKGLNKTYKKDCADSNSRWDRCVIETHKTFRGEYTFFKRGCHDGETFHKDLADVEFQNLTANNFTTCAFSTKVTLACFTFCMEDYCNGPQPEPDPCANATNGTSPDGVSCGINGIHDNSVTRLLQLAALTVVLLCLLKS